MIFCFFNKFSRGCLCHMLRNWINFLYGCWWILAEALWFICRHHWSCCDCPFGDDCSNLHLWPWKVCLGKFRSIKGFFFNLFRNFSTNRFTEDIYQMTGHRPGIYWQATWRFIGPGIMICILTSSIFFMIMDNPTYKAWNAEKVRLIDPGLVCPFPC